MFKKILIAIIMAASSSLTLAATPYVGGSLGIADVGNSGSTTVSSGAVAKLFSGYGTLVGMNKNVYLGCELNVDLGGYSQVYGANYGIGASFIPGLMITKDIMLYGRAGVEANRNTKQSSSSTFGSQLGFGLQTSLTNNWDMRAEYVKV